MYKLKNLPWKNRFASLPNAFYARVEPRRLEKPYWISVNPKAAELIGLDPTELQSADFLEFCAGGAYPDGCEPYAMLYSGHQFGHYVEQLGDGRAITLGETQGWELQLKGSGETPFSRSGDGRAVLRSTIREYLCSEAMHGLGIPTTRALCMVGSEEEVCRERIETGAMLLRMSSSLVRFGSFEIFFHRQQYQRLNTLADFVIEHYYPEFKNQTDSYLLLLKSVVEKTAKMIAQWQLVGFAHGVMNTDNMSILGLTLDYGPFGFLDNYNPKFICNHSDHHGRYAFDKQPSIGLWNLNCLAHAMLPLLDEEPEDAVEKAKSALQMYQPAFEQAWLEGSRAKLGLDQAEAKDADLMTELLEAMHENQVDYTIFFRKLSNFQIDNPENDTALRDCFLDREAFDCWVEKYRQRLKKETLDDQQRKHKMDQVNPKYILRNYMAEVAIQKAEKGNFSEVDRLLKLLQKPFEEQDKMSSYADYPPAWASEISVSCSS